MSEKNHKNNMREMSGAAAVADAAVANLKEDDKDIVKMSEELGITPRQVISMIRNQAYRQEYNSKRNEDQKSIRQAINENPEIKDKLAEKAAEVRKRMAGKFKFQKKAA